MVMDPVGSVEHILGTAGLGHDMLKFLLKLVCCVEWMYIIVGLPYIHPRKREQVSCMDHKRRRQQKRRLKKKDAATVLFNKNLSLQFSASTFLNFMDMKFCVKLEKHVCHSV
jgi:hypothetical protein